MPTRCGWAKAVPRLPSLARRRHACASCHRLAEGGDDNHARSPGAGGELLDFNAPTVFNAALSFRLNWRGNFRTLEEQIEAVLLDPDLMNTTWEELLAELRADRVYRKAFSAAYGSAPAPAHVLDALATFERSLLTPDARFDRYLRGEGGALGAEEKQGYDLFKTYGCSACHRSCVDIGAQSILGCRKGKVPATAEPPARSAGHPRSTLCRVRQAV